MRLGARRAAFAVLSAAMAACGLISGADELRVDACLTAPCGSLDAATDLRGPTLPVDASRDRVVVPPPPPLDAGPPPPYCVGLVGVVSFDSNAIEVHEGGAPVQSGGVDLDPGKFGQSFDVGASSFAEWALGPSGVPLSTTEGTIAFWVQSDFGWTCPASRTLVDVFPSGPAVRCEPGLGGGVTMVGSAPEVSAFFGDGGPPRVAAFQHVAVTWRAGNRNGAATLTFSVAPLAGARLEASSTTTFGALAGASRLRLNLQGQGALGRFDDLGVWTRALSSSELTAISGNPLPLVTACHL